MSCTMNAIHDELTIDETQDTECSDEIYAQQRDETLTKYEETWGCRYPHKYQTDIIIPNYQKQYDHLEFGERHEEFEHRLAARIVAQRSSGSNLFFYTIMGDGEYLQVLSDKRSYERKEHFKPIHNILHPGDIIWIRGFVGKSKRGELSIMPREIQLLSPCMKSFPRKEFGIKDPVTRIKKRYLDTLVNLSSREVFVIRATVVQFLREFMYERDFMELPTPVLSPQAGGATARPFVTYHNELKAQMFLRIAPELYLKKLVIGGFDRVFEIGPQFRNEGIDPTHNPEFWTLEFYQAYTDYFDLMNTAENMLSQMAMKIRGTHSIEFTQLNGSSITIDFTPPFQRIELVPELERIIGSKFPTLEDTSELTEYLREACDRIGIVCPPPFTNTRLIDRLVGELIEPKCINPTFIVGHPLLMSPLAKWDRSNPYLSERFELFIAGKEVINAYTELNDPRVQKNNFLAQAKQKELGDDEAQEMDQDFVDAMEYGLPPTGGFGLGIERMVMFLSNRNTISDTIPFPARGFAITTRESSKEMSCEI